MARIHGKTGSVALGSLGVLGITNWSIDYKCAADDSTGMDSGGAKEFLAGLTEWSGSFSGSYDSTTGKVAPGLVSGACSFVAGTGTTVTYGCNGTTGTVIVTSVKTESSVDSVVKVSCDFQGSGVLT